MVVSRRVVQLISLTLLFTLTLGFGGHVRAELDGELERIQRQYREIQKQIELNSRMLQEATRQSRSLSEQLRLTERDLTVAIARVRSVEEQMSSIRAQIVEVSSDLKVTEEKLDERQRYLGTRLRAIYENGAVSYLEILLAATSFSDLVSRFDYLQRIIVQDARLMAEVKLLRERLNERKRLLEEKEGHLSTLSSRYQSEKQELELKKATKTRLLSEVQKDREKYEAALDELERVSRELNSRIQEIQRKLGKQVRGDIKMRWPTAGSISSYFGMRYHPIIGQRRMHTGIDIAAPAGQAIVASESGTVIYSGWLGGYGNTVIIAHDDRVSTLYGHCSTLAVSIGQEVQKGQTIGAVGSTGFSTGAHLHFEVRVNGGPVDPLGWL